MSKDLKPQSSNNEEIDLGKLFNLIGNAFQKLFDFIKSIFDKLFLAFVWFVFFIKQNFIKLAIAAIVGVILGFVKEKVTEPTYVSNNIIKQNYRTGDELYKFIGYLDVLISQKDDKTLENVLNMEPAEMSSVVGISVEPVVTENDKIREYSSYLKTLDSVVASTIEYDDFIENDNDFNYVYQQVSVKTDENINTSKIFEKIIENLNANEFFKREQEKDIIQLENKKLAIANSLEKSDSLQNTYKRVLEKTTEDAQGSEIGITFEGANNKEKTKEFELYLKDIELRNERINIERIIADKENIIELVSSKQENGVIDANVKILGKSISPKLFFGFLFSFITFLVLIGIKFLTYLERFKNRI